LQNEVIKSVGIDIGTSTTKFMISELTLGRVSSHFTLPHFDIIDRKVSYVSEIISTPLKNDEEIDLPPLVRWLEKEYRNVGILLSDIKTGAVIITGETAIKKNADALTHYLAERAGDFVVAIAGASLEGVLAGRGSGAHEHSKKSKGTIANIDIGGGTANVVIFQQGKVLETITFRVGGRLLEINEEGKVISTAASLLPWIIDKNLQIEKGKFLSFSELANIASVLCLDMLDVLAGKKTIESLDALVHSSSCRMLPPIQEVMISGGVGRMVLDAPPTTIKEVAKYQDIGPILASQLSKLITKYPFTVIKPAQTSRATVIGAGMQTTKISGSTITIHEGCLPLRNVPVVKIPISDMEFEQQIALAIMKGRELFQLNEKLPFAIGLGRMPYLTYAQIKGLAMVIGNQYESFFPNAEILVVVCENDMGKALGQALLLQQNLEVICIDQVIIEHGDYIDIGEPLHDTMVPVVVKTLAFS
jgi:ethanolamine utilization protein EutA